jgi:RND family efflux transporter MFP subunit
MFDILEKRLLRWLLVLLVGVLLAILVFYLDIVSSPVAERLPQEPIKQVFGEGRIEGRTEIVILRPEIVGLIGKVVVREGDEVRKDDVLIELVDKEYHAEVDLANSRVKAAECALRARNAQCLFANQELERGAKTLERGAITPERYEELTSIRDTAAADLETAKANLDAERQQLKVAEIRMSHTKLLSPIDGQVLKVGVKEGEFVSPNAETQEPTVQVADNSEFRVRAFVDEIYARLVKPGQTAIITDDTGFSETAVVSRVSPFLGKKVLFSDRSTESYDTKTREVWLHFDKKPKLVIGLRVDVVIDVR